MIKFKNRYGNEYWFRVLSENTYTVEGSLDYWRYGGNEGEERVDFNNLGFADPSGGPFFSPGYKIDGRKVTRIYTVENMICFEVE